MGRWRIFGVGQLFMAAFFPGFVLSGLYMGYILIVCLIHPEWGPPLPLEERNVPFSKKMTILVTTLLPTLSIIFAVLGTSSLGLPHLQRLLRWMYRVGFSGGGL